MALGERVWQSLDLRASQLNIQICRGDGLCDLTFLTASENCTSRAGTAIKTLGKEASPEQPQYNLLQGYPPALECLQL